MKGQATESDPQPAVTISKILSWYPTVPSAIRGYPMVPDSFSALRVPSSEMHTFERFTWYPMVPDGTPRFVTEKCVSRDHWRQELLSVDHT